MAQQRGGIISKLYQKVKRPSRLRKAWKTVYESGVRSKSVKTRNIIKDFNKNSERHISRLYNQLHKRTFKFDSSDGVLLKRPPKTPRPIVIASVPNRIVQRSILDVLQEEPSIKKYFVNDSSFGGIEDGGVPKAIKEAYNEIRNGAKYYIRSDIQEFFRNIPKEIVLSIIQNEIDEPDFNELLLKATEVELSNLDKLGEYRILFPIQEIGVAQGCCLSPLIGNILLSDLDHTMNGRGIRCLRYIDDFIILGTTKEKVFKAFNSAQEILKKYKLKAYVPLINSSKADCGYTKKGFKFLGCEILEGFIRPDKKSCGRLLDKVKKELSDSLKSMRNPIKCKLEDDKSFSDTLKLVDNIVHGWGNQYYFCNDNQLLDNIDLQIDRLLIKYITDCKKLIKSKYSSDQKNKRRLIGVHLLTDSKSDPIVKSLKNKR